MNEENLQQQLDQFQTPEEIPNLWSRPESVSREIFGVEPSPARAYNKDTARGYLVRQELNSVKSNIGLIALLDQAQKTMIDLAIEKARVQKIDGETVTIEIEKIIKDFEMLKDYFRDEQASTTVTSRSKRGFGMAMAKTDKRIQSSELNDLLIEDEKEFGEGQQENPRDKIRGAIPFLRKKEM